MGPMRFLQKRVRAEDCKRSSTVERYKRNMENCYSQNFYHGEKGNEEMGNIYEPTPTDITDFLEEPEFLKQIEEKYGDLNL